MTPRKMILFVLSAASLALPAAAGAQQYYEPYGRAPYAQQPDYGQSRGDYGDWNARRRRFAGYPQFQGIEQHIRREIQEGVQEDMIAPEDARDLVEQLRQIRMQEMREFDVHGWNLPNDDRWRLQARLERLDRLVDETRDEQ